MSRVVLAMSGGVDSSAAAYLLQEENHDVVGLFMRSGATEEQTCASTTGLGITLPTVGKAHKQGCCSASDAADARRVADMLDIPFHALNFQDAFVRIKDYFADEYLAGRTPNPCVMCNNWLKFGKLWDFAKQVEAEWIASGHYARIELIDGEHALIRGRDASKDQSYVLFGIERDLLSRIIFPVGDFEKPAIRDKALQAGLRVFDKPDSQEICFIPDNDYAKFIKRYRGVQETAGEFVDTDGRVIGEHQGYEKFTVGQRKGIGIAHTEPLYVVGIKPEERQVVIGTREKLGRLTLTADRSNWLTDVPETFSCDAQIRYRHQAAPCTATITSDSEFRVDFESPQFGVAPGQAVVLYKGERVLGGGWIA